MYPQSRINIRCQNPEDGGPAPLTPLRPIRFSHDLSETSLFDDAALTRLLDSYPKEDIHVTTMDATPHPERPANGWRVGTTGALSGSAIMRAVHDGQLWLNIKRLAENAPVYRELLEQIYHALGAHLQCAVPSWRAATLLVSSPRASVYYHADAIPNILWQLRGQKKVLVYPHDDPRFAAREQIEMICSGEHEERLPYQSTFDAQATVFDLISGRALLWPQNSPHRVINTGGLNVSLSTEHITPQARARVNTYRGDRLLRRLGVSPGVHAPQSVRGRAKRALAVCHRGLRKLRRAPPISFNLTPTFEVDPDSELGIRDLG